MANSDQKGGGETIAYIGEVDHYRILEKVGEGAFGVVYRAQDTTPIPHIDVALKALPPSLSQNPEAIENLRKNFSLISKLNHPHIATAKYLHHVEKCNVTVTAKLGISPGHYLLVMEYVQGQTLNANRTSYPDHQVPIPEALRICRDIAKALDFAHQNEIIHRDIKPSNVMVSADGRIKVLDFGIAAEIQRSLSQLSSEGVTDIAGTPAYMAPEQWMGEKQSFQTDQYALAVVFHELVSGAVPFASVFSQKEPMIMREAVLNEKPAPLSRLNPKQNKALLKALSKQANDRYPTCNAFITNLEGSHPKKTIFGKKTVSILLGIVLITLFAVIFSQFSRDNSTKTPPVALPSDVLNSLAEEVLKLIYQDAPQFPRKEYIKPSLRLEIFARRHQERTFRPIPDGDDLASKVDHYIIAAQTLSPGYLYIFQIDSSGRSEWLFPKNDSSEYSSGENPVDSMQTILLPTTEDGNSLYLDTVSGYEYIYVVFSAERWSELEAALSKPIGGRAKPQREAPKPKKNLGQEPKFRGIEGIKNDDTLNIEGLKEAFRKRNQPFTAPLKQPSYYASDSFLVIYRWFKHEP